MNYFYSSKKQSEIKQKLFLANLNQTVSSFLFFRFLTTLLILIVVFFMYSNLIAIIIALLFYCFYESYFLDRLIKQRSNNLDQEAMHFFEIVILALETGSDLEKSLKLACENIDSALAKEFNQTLLEIKFGKNFSEAIEAMQQRIPSENINNILLSISQTHQYGTKILDILKDQKDFLQKKDFLYKKEIINKIPIKVSVISVLFILPLILVLILGPLIITLLS